MRLFPPGDIWRAAWAGWYAEPLLNERLGANAGAGAPDAAILGYPVARGPLSDPLGGREVPRPDRRVGAGPPARLSLGHGGGTPRCRWKIPGLCPRPASAAGALLSCTCLQDGPHAMGLADRESARDGAHYNAHAAAWHPLCIDWLKGRG